MDANIVLIPGDGIGPEVIAEAKLVLQRTAELFGHAFQMPEHAMGGCAIDEFGDPLPPATLDACKNSQAILLGAVGGPKWDDPKAKTRPEAGLLRMRKELGLFANLRPVKPHGALLDSSPLKRQYIEGTDILFVRELTGGIYFGESGLKSDGDQETAFNSMTYSTHEIERVVRVAARAAMGRRKKLTSVDKANVLEVSRLWRRVAERVVREEFPELEYEVVLVDAMAMHLISRPATFDVVVTGNLFGDILTDEGAMLPGSMGLLPSASIGDSGPGLYEPIHGSAPDIAGQGVANPLATILASGMLLRHSLGLAAEAAAVESAVQQVLDAGHRPRDLASKGEKPIGTRELGGLVVEALRAG